MEINEKGISDNLIDTNDPSISRQTLDSIETKQKSPSDHLTGNNEVLLKIGPSINNFCFEMK
jgi:hypothetical protein